MRPIEMPDALLPLTRIWRHRNYAWFMGGMAPSLVTSWMQRIGTGWLAWELTHQNAWVGAIVAADYAPMLVLAPYVGALTDRSDPVEQQKLAQWLCLLQSLAVSVLTVAGMMTIEILFTLCLLLGCLHPFNAIARHSITPASVPREELPTALAVDSATFNLSRFVGPSLAGIVIAASGAWLAFAFNVLGCACYLVGLYQLRLPKVERQGHGQGQPGARMTEEMLEGLRYVWRHPGMGPLLVLMALSAVLIRPLQDLLPGFAAGVFMASSSGLGWLTGAMGIGATIAAVGIAMHGHVAGLTLGVLLALAVNIVATLGFVATTSLPVALLFAALWGASLTFASTATQALLQSAVEGRLRGRVMSLYTMIYRGVPFLGALVIGQLGDSLGLRLAFAGAALLAVLPVLAWLPRRRAMTIAMEGRDDGLDNWLLSGIRAWSGMHHEMIADARQRMRALMSATRLDRRS